LRLSAKAEGTGEQPLPTNHTVEAVQAARIPESGIVCRDAGSSAGRILNIEMEQTSDPTFSIT
jgi:hypothetical protein